MDCHDEGQGNRTVVPHSQPQLSARRQAGGDAPEEDDGVRRGVAVSECARFDEHTRRRCSGTSGDRVATALSPSPSCPFGRRASRSSIYKPTIQALSQNGAQCSKNALLVGRGSPRGAPAPRFARRTVAPRWHRSSRVSHCVGRAGHSQLPALPRSCLMFESKRMHRD